MSKSRAKGTRFESELVAWFNAHGFPHVERRALAGKADRGDLSGLPGVMIEAKSATRMELAAWMDEVRTEKANAGAQVGVCVVKRRGKGTGSAYAVMELSEFVELIR